MWLGGSVVLGLVSLGLLPQLAFLGLRSPPRCHCLAPLPPTVATMGFWSRSLAKKNCLDALVLRGLLRKGDYPLPGPKEVLDLSEDFVVSFVHFHECVFVMPPHPFLGGAITPLQDPVASPKSQWGSTYGHFCCPMRGISQDVPPISIFGTTFSRSSCSISG